MQRFLIILFDFRHISPVLIIDTIRIFVYLHIYYFFFYENKRNKNLQVQKRYGHEKTLIFRSLRPRRLGKAWS